MTHSQHNPLPLRSEWSQSPDNGLAQDSLDIYSKRGECVATLRNDNKENHARLITASVNAIGAMAEYLGCNPVELAERMAAGEGVALIEALERVPARYGSKFTDKGDRIAEQPTFIVETLARLKGENNI